MNVTNVNTWLLWLTTYVMTKLIKYKWIIRLKKPYIIINMRVSINVTLSNRLDLIAPITLVRRGNVSSFSQWSWVVLMLRRIMKSKRILCRELVSIIMNSIWPWVILKLEKCISKFHSWNWITNLMDQKITVIPVTIPFIDSLIKWVNVLDLRLIIDCSVKNKEIS